jgi:putative N6-adenine-specific DNA methylase
VAAELRELGCPEVRAENGRVLFSGDLGHMVRANLWLRTADRVWLVLGSFPAASFEELFCGVRALPWGDLLPPDAAFPVEAHSHGSRLTSLRACQSVAKKAIVESLKAAHRRTWFEETGPVYRTRVWLVDDGATVTVDTSGPGLHRRGYRTLNAPAPLRETLAAALVKLSVWRPERLLVDPFCGSGTIALEAALLGLRRAPGLFRRFAAEDWPGSAPWAQARREAEEAFDRRTRLRIVGRDVDPEVLRLARVHLRRAGLEGRGVVFEEGRAEEFHSAESHGVMVTNPPYGQRLKADQARLYAALGRALAPLLGTWSVYVLTSDPAFEKHFGYRAVRRRKLYNGMLACTFYQYPGPRPPADRTAGDRA